MRTRWRVIGALFIVSTMVLVLAATSDARGRLTYVIGQTTHLHKNATGSANVSCPQGGGVHMWGGGQFVDSDPFSTTLTTSGPFDGKDHGAAPDERWRSTARDTWGHDELTAVAICAREGTIYVSRTVKVRPGRDGQTAKVTCRGGTSVVGGGVTMPAEFEEHGWIASSTPADGKDKNKRPDDGWMATGGIQKGTSTMRVTAACADERLTYPRAEIGLKSRTDASGFSRCGHGRDAVGGGVVSRGRGRTAIVTSAPFDNADRRSRPDDGWQGEFDNYSRTKAGHMTVYAICLR